MINGWLERNRAIVLTGTLLLVAGSIGFFLMRYQRPAPIEIVPPAPTNTPAPTATPGPIRVYVSGAVVAPEVYDLPPGSIGRDALDAAGGPADDADLDAVNLAQPLADGMQFYVPHEGEAAPPISEPDNTPPTPAIVYPLNLNTATQLELESLPGIGPVTAESIIAYREQNGPFPSIEAIQNVNGIGPATFDDLKELITVE